MAGTDAAACVVFALCAAMYNGCNGAPLSLYFSSTNCRGQGFEAQYPYQAVDTGSCPADALRTSTKAALNLRWASVPKTNAGLMKAVTNAPTVVGVKADGTAFQYYSSGVIPCTTEATATTVNRECWCACFPVACQTFHARLSLAHV